MNSAVNEFESVVEQYQRPLLSFVRSRMRSATDAEDIVQEIWIRSMGALKSGVIQNTRAYLHRVAHNLITDHVKARARENREEDAILSELPDARLNTERDLLNQEELASVEAAIANMSDRSRQIFLMARVEGLSYAEIGRKLGISRQTVHEHMTRAILSLQRSLQEKA